VLVLKTTWVQTRDLSSLPRATAELDRNGSGESNDRKSTLNMLKNNPITMFDESKSLRVPVGVGNREKVLHVST
jgi:hypothetical protein